MNDLIDKRNERTRKRKQVKRKMDSVIGLSASDNKARNHFISLVTEPMSLADKTIRLLDEGYIDNGFVIKKGTMEKYLNGKNQYVRGWEFDGEDWVQTEVLNLTDDFTGTVNIGHQEFSTFPFLVGEWTREDLSLVDTENDRHGLDVRLNLDEDSIFVKELQRKPYDIGVSAEFWYHVNEADTESLSEMLGTYMPVLDEIFIFAYGLVGECGNVNSSGLELKKETEMPTEKTNIEELELGLVGEEAEELDIEVEVESLDEMEEIELDAESETEIPPTETEDESAEEETEESAEEAEEEESVEEVIEEEEEEQTEAEEEEVEEAEVEEVEDEESEDDEDESDEDDALAETLKALQNQIDTLTNTVKDLTEQNVALKKSNRKLSNKLQTEKKKKEEFIENAKGLSVALLPNEEKEQKEEPKKESVAEYYNGNGIAEL